MFEVATTTAHRDAIERAHHERAEAFADLLAAITRPIRSLSLPQVGTRRWRKSPQGSPAGH
ncbi:hypothetical protein CLV78_103162 [Aliiruegeria haliotis]|uniref:Uncharacterized protein n=1 Tax=Aliiruegeria haliotis TaxID=1280846 RepID=A0A2T0RSX7_9RHOB|nr:hypothetical protein [Aliiruegeria haliotis]PRY24296.1 hypothetical protein CLV78_103162 [Aliiruegeria haliotis]